MKTKILSVIAGILCALTCIVTAGEGLPMVIITEPDISMWGMISPPWYYPFIGANILTIRVAGLALLVIASISFVILIKLLLNYFKEKNKK